MIACIGDIHGSYHGINKLVELGVGDDVTFIQVGDFGYYKHLIKDYPETPFKVYFIDGNHEDHKYLFSQANGDVTEVKKNLFYVRRGSVLNIDGYNIGFLGGGCSVDKYIRLRNGYDWSEFEVIGDEAADKLIEDVSDLGGIDFLITHAPPTDVKNEFMPPLKKWQWGLPTDWTDVSEAQVQRVWEHLGRPEIYSGHLHRPFTSARYNARVLDINEIITVRG